MSGRRFDFARRSANVIKVLKNAAMGFAGVIEPFECLILLGSGQISLLDGSAPLLYGKVEGGSHEFEQWRLITRARFFFEPAGS